MKLVRRGVAVVLQLLLVEASMLGGGAACVGRLLAPSPGLAVATLDVPEAADAHAAHTRAHQGRTDTSGHFDVRSAPANDRDAPDHGPHGMTHCGIAPACAAFALASVTTELEVVLSSGGRAQLARFDTPRSATAAPEPPPPRA